MSLETFLTLPAVIVRAAVVTDAYGDSVPDWDNATRTATECWLAQAGSNEILAGRDHTSADAVAYFRAGTDITPTDRVEADGRTWEVNGVPVRARTPAGLHHLEVPLVHLEG